MLVSKVTVVVFALVETIVAGIICSSSLLYTCTNTFLVPKLWLVATLVWFVNVAATVAFCDTSILVNPEPSPYTLVNEPLTADISPVPKSTSWLTKFLTVIAELSFAAAADALNELIKASLWVWAAPDKALMFASRCVSTDELKALMLASKWVSTEALKVAINATLCACAEADVAPVALAVCADADKEAILASKWVSTEALNAEMLASRWVSAEADKAAILASV